MRYEMLDWDSEFFGLPVARITEASLTGPELSDLLVELKRKGVHLVYWSSRNEVAEDVVAPLGGQLTDQKTMYAVELNHLDFATFVNTPAVEPYVESMFIADIEGLAVESGRYSRFAIDKNLPKDRFEALYITWIHRSITKEIADEVLVIRDGERVVGMVTLGETKGRGEIGLVAVHRNYRGRGYGETLVRAAQRWFLNRGYDVGQVVTQGMNTSACRLYEKCGYFVESVHYLYHFWPHKV